MDVGLIIALGLSLIVGLTLADLASMRRPPKE